MTQKQYDFLPDDFYDRPVHEREKFLKANADEVKQEDFFKPLAHEERAELKDDLSEVSIDLSNKQEEYNRIKEKWRDEIIKPLKEKRKEVIEKLKTGQEQIHGTVVYIRDQDKGRVIKMATDGTELESRPMRPSEKQITTHSNIRKINSQK